MSAQASPFRVGAFVVGAVALVLAGLIAFGSGELFKQRLRFVAYFPGSVAGLRVGAPVAFRGVPIGEVTQIHVRYDPSDMSVQVPVHFDLIQGSVDDRGQVGVEDVTDEIRKLIDAGLRAQLVPQSFVTGQLSVQLEVRPDAPAERVGTAESGVIEIPTIPSTIDVLDTQLKALLGDSDEGGLQDLMARLERIASGENAEAVAKILANVADFTETLGANRGDVARILDESGEAVARLDDVIAEISTLVADARTAVERYGAVAVSLADPEAGLAPVIAGARDAAASLARMADQINNAVAETRPGMRDFSQDTLPAIDGLVLDLEQLAQTLNRVADELERDPSGFFLGRGQREGIR
jgi:paraquat-inducible protein B